MATRQRIALSTAGIMILILLVVSLGIYTAMSRNLHSAMDSRLRAVYDTYRQNPAAVSPLPGGGFQVDLPELDPFTSPGMFMQVVNRQGVVNDQSASLAGQQLPIPDGVLEMNATRSATFYETTIGDADIRVYSAPVFLSGVPEAVAFVQIAESLEPVNATLDQLRDILILGSILATVAVSSAAWFVAGAAMRPVARVSATAHAIGATGDLSRRIEPPESGDEVEQLARTFNTMLDQLEASFQMQRRFVADASHELRTPLTALRGNTEIMRRMVSRGEVDREMLVDGLGELGSEVDRMTRLVQDLLVLARTDTGWKPEMSTVDLAAIAREAAHTIEPLASAHQFRQRIPEGQSLTVTGNADQLKQLVLILLDNAIKHTPDGTTVTLRLGQVEGEARLEVEDDGPGIDPEHQARLFERFYRPDSARTRSTGGTGLGLSIADRIAALHDGTLTVDSTPDRGTRFTFSMPIGDNRLT